MALDKNLLKRNSDTYAEITTKFGATTVIKCVKNRIFYTVNQFMYRDLLWRSEVFEDTFQCLVSFIISALNKLKQQHNLCKHKLELKLNKYGKEYLDNIIMYQLQSYSPDKRIAIRKYEANLKNWGRVMNHYNDH